MPYDLHGIHIKFAKNIQRKCAKGKVEKKSKEKEKKENLVEKFSYIVKHIMRIC